MFDQIRVLELASVLAGPSVGQFFAELGAEVIKIENPRIGGDVTRSWLARGEKTTKKVSSYFSCVNWGKKSVELDLTNKNHLEKFRSLVIDADIVITSYKPGDDKKLGVDFKSLVQIKPDLIYGHITGYGNHDNRVGYDAVIQAESGFMSLNGEKGGSALKMPVALMDVLAAHHLKQGLLVALIRRLSTGNGDYVPVSLIDAAVSSLMNQSANWLVGGISPKRKGNEHPNIAPYGDVFSTRDEVDMIIAVGNDKQFKNLCEVLKIDSTGFETNADRVEKRAELNLILNAKISERNSEELVSTLNGLKVPVGRIRSINEVFENPQESWFHAADSLRGVRNFMAMPISVNRLELSPPPILGEHNEEILGHEG